jgi:hypothetical protein
MPDHKEEIERFFAAYAKRSNDALRSPPIEDVDGVVTVFAPYFVEASPKGVMGGPNGDEFRKMVPQGFAKYREVGGKAMRVTRVKTTELDDINALARVDWEFDYVRKSDGRSGVVAFQNIYLLNFADGSPKVFAYITPDEEQAMKDHGLI